MKLTNTIRESFVRAVMADVPQVDYQEVIQKAATAAVLAALPPLVKAAWENEETRPYINTHYRNWGNISVADLPGTDYYGQDELPVLSKKDEEHLAALAKKNEEQIKRHVELGTKLKGAAFACSTRKALAELLPEFEKYLPADDTAAIRTLPVVANIVADFTKAGWPKGKK